MLNLPAKSKAFTQTPPFLLQEAFLLKPQGLHSEKKNPAELVLPNARAAPRKSIFRNPNLSCKAQKGVHQEPHSPARSKGFTQTPHFCCERFSCKSQGLHSKKFGCTQNKKILQNFPMQGFPSENPMFPAKPKGIPQQARHSQTPFSCEIQGFRSIAVMVIVFDLCVGMQCCCCSLLLSLFCSLSPSLSLSLSLSSFSLYILSLSLSIYIYIYISLSLFCVET